MSLGMAFVLIVIMLVVFSGLVIYKYDLPVLEPVNKVLETKSSERPAPEPALEDDYKVFHRVNVNRANVRERGSVKSKIVIVLEKDTRVKVLEEKGNWTKIKVGETTGWIYSTLLVAKIE